MDPDDEQAAREGYLATRARTGFPPVTLSGETVMQARERCGGPPMTLWALVRFDPDRELARRMLVAAVDYLRSGIVESRRWVGVDYGDRPEPAPPHEPSALAPFSRHAVPLMARDRLIAMEGGSEHVAEAARRVADRILSRLAENARTVGLEVTDEAVVDLQTDTTRTVA